MNITKDQLTEIAALGTSFINYAKFLADRAEGDQLLALAGVLGVLAQDLAQPCNFVKVKIGLNTEEDPIQPWPSDIDHGAEVRP